MRSFTIHLGEQSLVPIFMKAEQAVVNRKLADALTEAEKWFFIGIGSWRSGLR